ncbi:hypothetical protein PsorP6_006421 [Peronosclerospora sorghi]|uniref:Uncharacterized protein n=1 Tax=Peronosclerospora sorghi TaxID=230839 RepID=A0ACC0W5P1_9STRA|nr:hypothetical protein PsorP6_006421 [Peronosclerospora sorghi]
MEEDEESVDGMPFVMREDGRDDALVCPSYYNEILLLPRILERLDRKTHAHVDAATFFLVTPIEHDSPCNVHIRLLGLIEFQNRVLDRGARTIIRDSDARVVRALSILAHCLVEPSQDVPRGS